jgi:hypothetical protein
MGSEAKGFRVSSNIQFLRADFCQRDDDLIRLFVVAYEPVCMRRHGLIVTRDRRDLEASVGLTSFCGKWLSATQ